MSAATVTTGPEVWFYHLEASTLEQTLPELLEKSRQRNWRVYIHGDADEQLEALDSHLWSYASQSFLAHGRESEPHGEQQPILLGMSGDLVNNPDVYMSVAPVNLPDSIAMQGLQRCLILFQGGDHVHLAWARGLWKRLKSDGHNMAYWKQNEQSRWERMQ